MINLMMFVIQTKCALKYSRHLLSPTFTGHNLLDITNTRDTVKCQTNGGGGVLTNREVGKNSEI